MLTLVAVLGRSCAVVPIVVLGLLVGAHEALGCVAINDFVKDVENGKSEKILDSRFTLVDMRKDGLEAVRRYSHVLPYCSPPKSCRLRSSMTKSQRPGSSSWAQEGCAFDHTRLVIGSI